MGISPIVRPKTGGVALGNALEVGDEVSGRFRDYSGPLSMLHRAAVIRTAAHPKLGSNSESRF